MLDLLQDEKITNLKELEDAITLKAPLTKVKKLPIIPSDTNNFSKLIDFDDKTFLFDVEKQKKVESLFFTKKELEEVSRKDYIYILTFAYYWVYSFRDIDGKPKVTPNLPSLEFEIKNKDAIVLMSEKATDELLFGLVGIDDITVLSDWEKALVVKEVYAIIQNPIKSAMGLVQNL